MDDPVKNSIMNQLLRDYAQQLRSPHSDPPAHQTNVHQVLELVSELPEEEESEENDDSEGKVTPSPSLHKFPSLFSTPADRPAVHHKGGSDSSHPSRSSKKNTAQLLFKEELQRRCASLMITSEKLIAADDSPKRSMDPLPELKDDETVAAADETEIPDQTYTEVIESRNVAVGPSALAKSGSTRDSNPENNDETYDVLVTIKASQQRQETEPMVNYIIDTDFAEPEFDPSLLPTVGEDFKQSAVSAASENALHPENETRGGDESEISKPHPGSKRTHRRTDSAAIDWQKLNKIIQRSEPPEAYEGNEAKESEYRNEKMELEPAVNIICDSLEDEATVDPTATETVAAGECIVEEGNTKSDTDCVTNKTPNES